MKKAIIYGMSLALILSMTACGGSNENAADKSQETSTPEVSQSVESSTPAPEQTTQTAPETTPTPESVSTPAQENTTAPQETDSLFTETDETMYATTTVNVRSSYSTNSDKLGSLTKAQSVTRTGIGTGDAAGWSRIEFNGKVAYVSSDYLSATKPQVNTSTGSSGSSGGQTSKPSSKPSTGGNSGSSSGGSSGGSTAPVPPGGSGSSGGSSSGGLGDLANQIQQGRDDMGYSGGGNGGALSDEDYDWISGNVQLD
ncbi:SH3 domain-containing protein [uncultured Flavonifractor sp.]|uniref:SH3 domain-containing protein n=1 Tax=uncultured Flavonifractor sp. TaxID=1193534 RepID=UPI00262475CC|nr:SH3 domain-containing protein [uncultured Flavonifractor sp.]